MIEKFFRFDFLASESVENGTERVSLPWSVLPETERNLDFIAAHFGVFPTKRKWAGVPNFHLCSRISCFTCYVTKEQVGLCF